MTFDALIYDFAYCYLSYNSILTCVKLSGKNFDYCIDCVVHKFFLFKYFTDFIS